MVRLLRFKILFIEKCFCCVKNKEIFIHFSSIILIYIKTFIYNVKILIEIRNNNIN
jgi:hypothetical protein